MTRMRHRCKMIHMSEMHASPDAAGGRRVPVLSLRWRLSISLDESSYDRDQIAEIIGVAPATISRWTNGHFKRMPPKAVLNQWALATGVDPDWLIGGTDFPSPTRTNAGGANLDNKGINGRYLLSTSRSAEKRRAAAIHRKSTVTRLAPAARREPVAA